MLNAAAGGILRDVLTREEPLVFKPGQFYVRVALFGAVVFVTAGLLFEVSAESAAILAIAATFAIRTLSVWPGWRTTSFEAPPPSA